jgi:hypothetical protein
MRALQLRAEPVEAVVAGPAAGQTIDRAQFAEMREPVRRRVKGSSRFQDASNFSEDLKVEGVTIGGHRVLRCQSPAIPNAIAALLLFIRDQTGQIPHVYFGWTEGNPITYLLKFLAFGEGDTAPVTREVLRRNVKNPMERPRIHVG